MQETLLVVGGDLSDNFLRADKTWERKKKEMTSDEEEEETFYQNEGGRLCRICGAPRRYKRTEPNDVRIFVCTSNDNHNCRDGTNVWCIVI
jgi:hypothetical protein